MWSISKLTASLALLFSTACMTASEGRPDDVQTDWRPGGKGDGETCDFEAMPAATYYDLFAYKSMVSDSGSTWYRVGLTWQFRASLDNGDQANLRAYFLENDRVIVEYDEQHSLGGNQSEDRNRTVVITRKRIDPQTRTLTLDGVGTGTPVTVLNANGGCQPGINFNYSGDLRSPGISGKGTQIVAGLTSAYVIDPDHLDQVPSETARRWFEEDVASGKITVIRK